MSDIPSPLIFEIISRLPVKSIFRFRCVSKSWKSTIDESHFIKLHLKNFTNQTLILKVEESSLYAVDFPALTPATKIDLPFKSEEDSTIFTVGSCNGLICLFDLKRQGMEAIIFNPATKQYRKLPHSPVKFPSSRLDLQPNMACGFGYDQVNDDYKLVRISQLGSSHREAMVYSLKMNSWSNLVDFPSEYVFTVIRDSGVYVNGCLHWCLLATRKGEGPSLVLIALDLGLEKWKFLAQPNYTPGNFRVAVGVCGGSLFVVCNYPSVRSEVWVMKEYGVGESWTKLYSISASMIVGSLDCLQPIGYSGDGLKVLILQENSKLFWFDLKRQKVAQVVKIGGVPNSFYTDMLVETLVPVVSHMTKKQAKKEAKKEAKKQARKSKNSKGFISKVSKLKL